MQMIHVVRGVIKIGGVRNLRSSRSVSDGLNIPLRLFVRQEAVWCEFAVRSVKLDNDVSDMCVSGDSDDGLDQHVDQCVAGRLRIAFRATAAAHGRTVTVGDPSLPQQQHAVGDVSRRVSVGQCVERHAGNRAVRNVQLRRQFDSGARNVT